MFVSQATAQRDIQLSTTYFFNVYNLVFYEIKVAIVYKIIDYCK